VIVPSCNGALVCYRSGVCGVDGNAVRDDQLGHGFVFSFGAGKSCDDARLRIRTTQQRWDASLTALGDVRAEGGAAAYAS